MRVLGLIPARGGSKRLLRKNILECAGKPLIAWTIEAARKAKLIDAVWVSTEDSEISQIAKKWGAQVLFRPPELAQDDTPSIDVVKHALNQLDGFDYVCLLQPTSPCRTADDIDSALALARPALEIIGTDGRRINGAIYIWPTNSVCTNGRDTLFEMPSDRSIDIDTLEDLKRAEEILSARG